MFDVFLVMLVTTSFTGMLFVSLAIGVTKGIRTVYMNIVIPSYVPLERLPFASGIQMFFNGIVIITLGSLLGKFSNSRYYYVISINFSSRPTFVPFSYKKMQLFQYFFLNRGNMVFRISTFFSF